MLLYRAAFDLQPSTLAEAQGILEVNLEQEIDNFLTSDTHPDIEGTTFDFHYQSGAYKAVRILRTKEIFGAKVVSHIDELIYWQHNGAIRVIANSEKVSNDPSGTFNLQFLDNEPPLVRALVNTFTYTQGMDLASKPVEIVAESNEFQQVLDELSNPSRYTWMIVASSTRKIFTPSEKLDLLHKIADSVGTRCYLRIISQDVLDNFNSEIGIAHSIPSYGFRVFAPAAVLDKSKDAYRHPRFAHPLFDGKGVNVRSDDLPPGNVVFNQETELGYQRLFAEARSVGRQNHLRENRDRTKQVLAQASSSAKLELEEEINRLQAELEIAINLASEQEQAAIEARFSASFADLQIRELAEQQNDLQQQNAYFRKVLHDHKLFSEAIAPEPDQRWQQIPNSFMEITDQIQSVPYLQFSGSLESVLLLDLQPNISAGLARCWGTLHTLSDYAKLKASNEFDGSLFQYLSSTSHGGHKVPNGYLALNESESVKNNPTLRKQRTFPVPEYVQPDKLMFMPMHARLLTGLATSPRMHFFDNTGADKRIYIGYIGAHLDTDGTN